MVFLEVRRVLAARVGTVKRRTTRVRTKKALKE